MKKENGAMSRFSVAMKIANNQDVQMHEGGTLPETKIRRALLRGVVDTGSSYLVLPEKVAKKLGLKKAGTAKVLYADRRNATREVVEEVRVELQGRHGTFRAIVEPARTTALIGAVVLEDLDLIVDCRTEKLQPRDPRQIIAEIE